MIFKEKTYNTIKYIALVVVPALATLVTSIGAPLGYAPQAQIISVIITAIGTFLGSLVVVSNNAYNKKQTEIANTPAGNPDGVTTDELQ